MSSEDCSASGVLPYLFKDNQLYIMLGLENRGLSDFGGFSDGSETSYDNAAREFSEETMGLICLNDENRGNKLGVKKSTEVMKRILSDQTLEGKLIKKIINPKNRYQMFIAPVARMLDHKEFEKMLDENDKRTFSNRIRSVEKHTVAWFPAQKIIEVLEDDPSLLKVNGVFDEKIFTLFKKSLSQRDALEFIKYLSTLNPITTMEQVNQLWQNS